MTSYWNSLVQKSFFSVNCLSLQAVWHHNDWQLVTSLSFYRVSKQRGPWIKKNKISFETILFSKNNQQLTTWRPSYMLNSFVDGNFLAYWIIIILPGASKFVLVLTSKFGYYTTKVVLSTWRVLFTSTWRYFLSKIVYVRPVKNVRVRS